MKKFIRKLFDSRNREVEAHLFLLILSGIVFMALSIYHVVCLQHAFDPNPYGEGFGCLLAGGGAAAFGQGLQRSNEKDKDDDSHQ
jgi:hypothetical protein